MRKCRATLVSLGLILTASASFSQSSPGSATVTRSSITPVQGTGAPTVPEPSLWDISATLRGSAGWRDNVLMSAVRPLNRNFWRMDGDVLLLRPLGAHADLIGFVSGDVLRYVSPPPDVPGEQEWAAELQGRWHPVTWFNPAIKGVAFLDDTFIDPSITEGSPEPVVGARAEGGYVMLTPQFVAPGGFTIEPSLQEKRIRFAAFGSFSAYPGDHTESTPGLRVTWKRSDRFSLSAAWYQHTRHYSELTQSAVGSRPLRGRLLSLHQREGELKATSRLEKHGTWTFAATVGRLESRDQAFGFLDYNEKRAQFELHWDRGPWRTIVSAEAKRFAYRIQIVGTGINVTPRVTEAYELVQRAERDLSPKWMLFAENRWERNRSNVEDFAHFHPFSYRTDTAQLGLQRSF